MNKPLLPIIIVLLLSLASPAPAAEIVVVNSGMTRPNRIVLEAFVEELFRLIPQQGLKSVEPHHITEVETGRDREINGDVERRILSAQPDLILAMGKRGLLAVRNIIDVPIVYLLVIHPDALVEGRSNIIGVTLAIPPEVQLDELKRRFPRIRKIGVVYDPEMSADVIKQARNFRPDLTITAIEATSPQLVPALIATMNGKVDALWMLPDITVTNRQTLKSYFLFSMENRVPVLTFSEKYLKAGATIAVTFDLAAIGVKGAELAAKILSGTPVESMPRQSLPQVKTTVNRLMADKIRIPVARSRGQ